MEDKEYQSQGGGFWWGLIIGGLAAGLVLLLLDQEEKENLRENFKSDLEKVLDKVKGTIDHLNDERKISKPQLPNKEVVTEVKAELPPVSRTKIKPAKKFFKKAGKRLKS